MDGPALGLDGLMVYSVGRASTGDLQKVEAYAVGYLS